MAPWHAQGRDEVVRGASSCHCPSTEAAQTACGCVKRNKPLLLLGCCRHRSLMGAEKEAAMLEGLLLAALYMYKARPPCSAPALAACMTQTCCGAGSGQRMTAKHLPCFSEACRSCVDCSRAFQLVRWAVIVATRRRFGPNSTPLLWLHAGCSGTRCGLPAAPW